MVEMAIKQDIAICHSDGIGIEPIIPSIHFHLDFSLIDCAWMPLQYFAGHVEHMCDIGKCWRGWYWIALWCRFHALIVDLFHESCYIVKQFFALKHSCLLSASAWRTEYAGKTTVSPGYRKAAAILRRSARNVRLQPYILLSAIALILP